MKLKCILTFLLFSIVGASAFAEVPRPRTQINPAPGETPVIPNGSLPDVLPVTLPDRTMEGVNATVKLLGASVGFFGDKMLQTRNPTSVQNLCSSILNTCSFDVTGNQSSTEIFETLNIAFGNGQINRQGYCDCLRTNVPHTTEAMDTLKTQLKTNLRTDVQNKLVRDFSLQLEDLHFYVRLPSFRSKVMEIKAESAANGNFRCLEEDDYKKAFDENPKCQALQLSDEAKERKLAEIFGSVTDISGGDLQSILSNIKDDVLMTDLKRADCSSPAKYSRVCFDRDRISLSRSGVGQISDRFLTKVLKSSSFSQNIIRISKEENHSPLEALQEMLQEMISSKSPEILELVDGSIINDSLFRKLSQGIRNNNLSTFDQGKITNALLSVIASGIEAHPGINQLLEDVTKFEEVAAGLGRDSLITHLEKDTDKIISDYRNKCDALITNFAEVACSTDDDLLNGMNEHDLDEYSHGLGIKDDQTKNLTTVLACESTGSHAFLKHLLPGTGLSKISDYYARKNGLMSTFERFKNEKFRDGSIIASTINNAVTRYGSSSSDFFDFDFFDAEISESNFSKLASKKGPLVTPVNENESGTKVMNEMLSNFSSNDSDQQQVSMEPGFYSNAIPATSGSEGTLTNSAANSEARFDPRQELREYLQGKVEKEELENLMSNTDDGLMKELMELKAEMESNQKKLLELSAENERLKLDSLKRKMDRLQNERAALEPEEENRERQINNVARRDSPLSNSNIGRNIPAATPTETGGSSAGSASAYSGQTSSEASLGALNRALLSSASNSGRAPASDKSSSPVVVPASSARSGSLEIKSQEVGLDLLNYLSNNGSDIQTLINLKTAGIIYKYKVVENGNFIEKEVLIEYKNLNEDVKKIIDKKIAQSDDRDEEILRLDNEIRELRRVYSYSALRMMLAEQIRK